MQTEEQQIEALVISLCGASGNRKILSSTRKGKKIEGVFSNGESVESFEMLIAIQEENIFPVMATIAHGLAEHTYSYNGAGWKRL
jgi:hypothetical protein